MLFQFLLFCLNLRKFLNNLIIYKNLNYIFSVFLPTFYFDRYFQTSLKVASVTFGLIFMKFKKLKDLHQENEKIDLQVFYLFELFPILSYSFPILPIQQLFSKYYSRFLVTSSDWNSEKVYWNQ